MTENGGRKGHDLKAVPQGFAIIAAGLGFVALSGWLLSVPLLSSFGSQLIPMAPSSALLFGLFGVAVFFRALSPDIRTVRWLSIAISVFGVSVALLLFCLSSQGIYLSVERLGMAVTGELPKGMRIGHMSPVTALSFVFSGLSFLIALLSPPDRHRQAALAGGLAALVIAVHGVFALAYFIGPPLLYGGTFIPPALPTSLAFAALGIALAGTVRPSAGPLSELPKAATARASQALLLVFILTAGGILTAGYFYYRNYESHYRSEVERQLTTVADLKTREIVQWRKERLGDASIFYQNSVFSLLAERYFSSPGDKEAEQQLRTWLQRVQQAYEFDRLCLVDVSRAKRITVPETWPPAPSALERWFSKVLPSGRIVFEDFYRNEVNHRIYLNILVPVWDRENKKIIGVLAMRVDPGSHLYPLITRWPSPSPTAETLLVRREGNEVVFLNQLRFRRNTALQLRRPLEGSDLPAAKAVLGEEGIVRGVDYRGVPVIAAVNAIPDSPWFLIARVDVAEVYSPLRKKLWEVLFFVTALLLGAGAGVGLIWRQQMAGFYREKYQAADALRESTEILRTIVDTSPLAIIVTDPQGTVTLWNSAAETTFGWRAGEVVGRQTPIIPPDLADEVKQERQRILDGRTMVDVETERVCKEGERIAVSYSATALRDANGRANAILIMVADIRKRKWAQEELERLKEELEERVIERTTQLEAANRELEAFSYSVSHDLRAPLRGIDGFSQALWEDYQDKPLDETGIGYLKRIRMATQRMGELIDDLLRLSRVSRCELRIQTADLSKVAREISEKLQKDAGQRLVDFEIQEGLVVQGDYNLMNLVMTNLLDNAWKFSGHKERARIEVGKQEDGSRATFFVRDNGAGFDMRYVDKLFLPFQRLHSIAEFSGTGIGLVTVRRIVERHGGCVWAEGEKGKGAAIFFSFPKKNAERH